MRHIYLLTALTLVLSACSSSADNVGAKNSEPTQTPIPTTSMSDDKKPTEDDGTGKNKGGSRLSNPHGNDLISQLSEEENSRINEVITETINLVNTHAEHGSRPVDGKLLVDGEEIGIDFDQSFCYEDNSKIVLYAKKPNFGGDLSFLYSDEVASLFMLLDENEIIIEPGLDKSLDLSKTGEMINITGQVDTIKDAKARPEIKRSDIGFELHFTCQKP